LGSFALDGSCTQDVFQKLCLLFSFLLLAAPTWMAVVPHRLIIVFGFFCTVWQPYILKINSHDGPSQVFLERANEFKINPKEYSAIYNLSSK